MPSFLFSGQSLKEMNSMSIFQEEKRRAFRTRLAVIWEEVYHKEAIAMAAPEAGLVIRNSVDRNQLYEIHGLCTSFAFVRAPERHISWPSQSTPSSLRKRKSCVPSSFQSKSWAPYMWMVSMRSHRFVAVLSYQPLGSSEYCRSVNGRAGTAGGIGGEGAVHPESMGKGPSSVMERVLSCCAIKIGVPKHLSNPGLHFDQVRPELSKGISREDHTVFANVLHLYTIKYSNHYLLDKYFVTGNSIWHTSHFFSRFDNNHPLYELIE